MEDYTMSFYETFIRLCNENGVKPTPTLKLLEISPSNLSRWRNGADVTSDILLKLSEYFSVPIDEFFRTDFTELTPPADDNANDKHQLYYNFRVNVDLFCSTLTGRDISLLEIKIISEYMGCSVTYLCPNYDLLEDKEKKICNTENEIILGILARAAINNDYKYLQVKISKIIISNLWKRDINKEDLIKIHLSKGKIYKLYDNDISPDLCEPLNHSDCIKIVEELDVSYKFIFTGRD